MKREEIRACIVRVGGTNCDSETKRAFGDLGAKAEIVHLNDLKRREDLMDYHVLVFPGGFSYGDYVRAGAILATSVVAHLGSSLKRFANEERPILGICNGFQVLVEAGLLPGFDNRLSKPPDAALAPNVPSYQCRWINLKNDSRGKCIFTTKVKKNAVLRIPVAHGEGRFIFEKDKQDQQLERLCENDQLVFRYCGENGEDARGKFPVNPNGSFHDIAGICDPSGTIFGLMPHPERAYYGWQQSNWTQKGEPGRYGDGKLIFESVVEYLAKKF
jgi:phosphoribosylformylglycinamidine synthase I